MKRHLLPITASSMKRVAFTILCSTVLMLLAAPAWASADPCNAPTVVGAVPAGSVNLDTTGSCSVVITVTAVDSSGKAIAFSAASTGIAAYDGSEDVLVGVQNSSGATLNSMPLSGADIFGFDGDGPCSPGQHTPAYSWCSTSGFTTYEGPNNTFSGISADHTSGTVNFTGGGIPNNNSTWFALEGGPNSLTPSAPPPIMMSININAPTVFDFSSFVGGVPTKQTIDYSNAIVSGGTGAASTNTTNTTFPGITMQVTLTPITDLQFQNLVAGTFAQNSKCIKQDFGGGNLSCAATTVLCAKVPSPQPSDFAGMNCPVATSGFINIIAKYSAPGFSDPSAVNNPGYLAATDDALTCTHSATCPQLHNIFTGIANDCCTTSGSPPLHFNSTFFPVSDLTIWYQPPGTTCDGDAGHVILQPVNADGTSVWKAGRTIPLKFRVCDKNGVSVGTTGVVQSFTLTAIISGTVANVDETIDATVPDSGFRFDPSAQQWIFNLSTKGQAAGSTYQYAIGLADGTFINFQYGLR